MLTDEPRAVLFPPARLEKFIIHRPFGGVLRKTEPQ